MNIHGQPSSSKATGAPCNSNENCSNYRQVGVKLKRLKVCGPECLVGTAVSCRVCDQWFHPQCITEQTEGVVISYKFCPNCQKAFNEFNLLAQRHREQEAQFQALRLEHAQLKERLDSIALVATVTRGANPALSALPQVAPLGCKIDARVVEPTVTPLEVVVTQYKQEVGESLAVEEPSWNSPMRPDHAFRPNILAKTPARARKQIQSSWKQSPHQGLLSTVQGPVLSSSTPTMQGPMRLSTSAPWAAPAAYSALPGGITTTSTIERPGLTSTLTMQWPAALPSPIARPQLAKSFSTSRRSPAQEGASPPIMPRARPSPTPRVSTNASTNVITVKACSITLARINDTVSQDLGRSKPMSTNGGDLAHKNNDEYLYCEPCDQERLGICQIHGPMKRIADSIVESDDPLKAINTLPSGLGIMQSSLTGAGLGIWTNIDLDRGIMFGPYQGIDVAIDSNEALTSEYCWEVSNREGPSHCIDGQHIASSNWLRYVNCASNDDQQNLTAFQYMGHIFYRTIRPIPAGSELLVWYGSKFAQVLGLDSDTSKHSIYNVSGSSGEPESSGSSSPVAENAAPARPQSNSRNSVAHEVDEKESVDLLPSTIDITDSSELYRCDACGDTYPERRQLRVHQVNRHRIRDAYVCKSCSLEFISYSSFSSHMTDTLHKGFTPQYVCVVFTCRQCPLEFLLYRNLQTHKRLVGHTNYDRQKVGLTGLLEKTVDGRVVRKVGRPPAVQASKRLIGHTNYDGKKVGLTDLLEKTVDGRVLRKPGRPPAVQSNVKHVCRQCSRRFRVKSALYKHMIVVHGNRSASSRICAQTVASTLKCPHCPLQCNCSRGFKHRSNRALASVTVKPKATLQCQLCNASASTTKDLQRHIVKQHRDQQCRACLRYFKAIGFLRRHLARHTENGDSKEREAATRQLSLLTVAGNSRQDGMAFDNLAARSSTAIASASRLLRSKREASPATRKRDHCPASDTDDDTSVADNEQIMDSDSSHQVSESEDETTPGDHFPTDMLQPEPGLPTFGPVIQIEGDAKLFRPAIVRLERLMITLPKPPVKRRAGRPKRPRTDEPDEVSVDDHELPGQWPLGSAPSSKGKRRVQHSCYKCNLSFSIPELLTEHQRAIHRVRVIYTCLVCQLTFNLYQEAREHQAESMHRGIDRKDVEAIPEPKKSSKRRRAVSKTTVDCDNDLAVNTRRVPRYRTTITCDSCKRTFDCFKEFEQHQNEMSHAGKIVSVDGPTDAAVRLNLDTDKHHICTICLMDFALFVNLKHHLAHVHGLRQYLTCLACKWGFEESSELLTHMSRREHTAGSSSHFVGLDGQPVVIMTVTDGEGPPLQGGDAVVSDSVEEGGKVVCSTSPVSNCPLCEQNFEDSRRLRAHLIAVHKRKLVYQCHSCQSEFYEYHQFLDHLSDMNHLDVFIKLVAPDDGKCDEVVSVVATEASEASVVTEEPKLQKRNPLQCGFCTRIFPKVRYLKTHILRMHGMITMYTCEFCKKEFKEGADIRTHQSATGHVGRRIKLVNPLTEEHSKVSSNVGLVLPAAIDNFERSGETLSAISSITKEGKQRESPAIKKLSPAQWKPREHPHKCSVCELSFFRFTNLRQHHMHTHFNQLVMTCSCESASHATFVDQKALQKHQHEICKRKGFGLVFLGTDGSIWPVIKIPRKRGGNEGSRVLDDPSNKAAVSDCQASSSESGKQVTPPKLSPSVSEENQLTKSAPEIPCPPDCQASSSESGKQVTPPKLSPSVSEENQLTKSVPEIPCPPDCQASSSESGKQVTPPKLSPSVSEENQLTKSAPEIPFPPATVPNPTIRNQCHICGVSFSRWEVLRHHMLYTHEFLLINTSETPDTLSKEALPPTKEHKNLDPPNMKTASQNTVAVPRVQESSQARHEDVDELFKDPLPLGLNLPDPAQNQSAPGKLAEEIAPAPRSDAELNLDGETQSLADDAAMSTSNEECLCQVCGITCQSFGDVRVHLASVHNSRQQKFDPFTFVKPSESLNESLSDDESSLPDQGGHDSVHSSDPDWDPKSDLVLPKRTSSKRSRRPRCKNISGSPHSSTSKASQDGGCHCQVCGFLMPEYSVLTDHLQSEHGIRSIICICNKCQLHFDSYEEVRDHHAQLNHSGVSFAQLIVEDISRDAASPCQSRSEEIKETEIDNDQQQTGHDLNPPDLTNSGLLECRECEQTFQLNEQLKRHEIQEHKRSLLFACSNCKLELGSISELTAHQAQTNHAGMHYLLVTPNGNATQQNVGESSDDESMPVLSPNHFDGQVQRAAEPESTLSVEPASFVCSLCEFTFDSLSHLREHELNWHGVVATEGITDDQAAKQTASKTGLHKCEWCDLIFDELAVLRQHMFFMHKIRTIYVCRECHKTTYTQEELLEHLSVDGHIAGDAFLVGPKSNIEVSTNGVVTLAVDTSATAVERTSTPTEAHSPNSGSAVLREFFKTTDDAGTLIDNCSAAEETATGETTAVAAEEGAMDAVMAIAEPDSAEPVLFDSNVWCVIHDHLYGETHADPPSVYVVQDGVVSGVRLVFDTGIIQDQQMSLGCGNELLSDDQTLPVNQDAVQGEELVADKQDLGIDHSAQDVQPELSSDEQTPPGNQYAVQGEELVADEQDLGTGHSSQDVQDWYPLNESEDEARCDSEAKCSPLSMPMLDLDA